MDIENKQGAAEPTPASTGSVAGEPIAWGIQFWGGDLHHEVFDTEEQAEREMYRGSPPEVCTARVVALYLKPTLTDAEREAIRGAAAAVSAYYGDRRHGEILLGLLERLG
jgi:hypothetical protein